MAFSLRAGTHWCHDFPKLARESGFYYNVHKTPVRIDWNRISTIDIDRIMRERDFLTIDENVNNVVDYSLESTYDIKILDPNFVKIFRLAQLSVEYLLYCRQYLDQSVIILKDDLKLKLEENQKLKRELSAAEEHVKELKEKSRDKYRWIEKKLSDSTGEIHKCPHCPKTFISSIFMSSHMTRRHSSPVNDEYRAEAEKLHNEIKTLKERLNETEKIIRSESGKLHDTSNIQDKRVESNEKVKIEEEYEKYREEMANLRSILFSEMQNFEETTEKKKWDKYSERNELVKQQGDEIQRLRDQLQSQFTLQNQSKHQDNHFWQSKIQEMENQHRSDIEKLNHQLILNQEATEIIKTDYTTKITELEEKSKNYIDDLVRKESRELTEINVQNHLKNSDTEIKKFELQSKNSHESFLKKNDIEIKEMDYNKSFEKSHSILEENSQSHSPKIRSFEIKSQNLMDLNKFNEQETPVRSSEDINSEASTISQSPMSKSESEVTESSEESGTIYERKEIPEEFEPKRIEKIKVDIQLNFDQRLRGLGVDPEWQGIPYTTYRQLIATMAHHRAVSTKKYSDFKKMRREILNSLSNKIGKKEKQIKSTENVSIKSPLNKLMSNVTHKAIKSLKVLKMQTIDSANRSKDKMHKQKFLLREKPSLMKLQSDLLPKKLDESIFQKDGINQNKNMEYSIFSPSKSINERYISSPQKSPAKRDVKQLFHSYESIKEFVKDSSLQSTQDFPKISGSEGKLDEIVSLPSSPKNSKSLLKPMTGSVGSLIKKKVLFDLDNEDSSSRDSPASSLAAGDDGNSGVFGGELTVKSGEIPDKISKMSQSEKIMEIARNIDRQLSGARQKPIGGVSLYSNAMYDEILGKSREFGDLNLDSSGIKGKIVVPQAKPRMLRAISTSNESNLDSEINEILRLD